MKKFLLCLAACLWLIPNALANTQTVTWANEYSHVGSGESEVLSGTTKVVGDVTFAFEKGSGSNDVAYYNNGSQVRMYTNNTVTISVPEGNVMTSIVITATASQPASNFTASVGSIIPGDKGVATWTGSASSITFTVSSAQVRMSTVEVTYGDGSGGGTTDPDPDPGTGDPQSSTVTFDFTANTYGAGPAYSDSNTKYVSDENVATQSPVSVTFNGDGSAWRFWNDGIRAYKGKNASFTVAVEGGSVTAVTWTVKSGATFALAGTTDNITSWEGEAPNVTFNYTNESSNLALITLTVTYETSADAKKTAGIAFAEKTVSVEFGSEFTGQTLTNPNSLTATYTSSNDAVATVDSATGAVTIKSVGVTTITAKTEETENFYAGEAFYTLNVTPGMLTVAEAIQYIKDGYTGTAQVKGIISAITEVSTSYGNATYLIVDDLENTENPLTVYRGYWLNGDKFTAEDQIEVGGKIVVEGSLLNYNGTLEIGTGNKVISYTSPDGTEPDQPDPDQPDQPGDDVSEDFTSGIGFPDGSANVPTEEAEFTSTETGITYSIMGCYANKGYLMMNSKNYEGAFISWSLDFPMSELIITTTSGCSTNEASKVDVYAGEELVGTYLVNVQNAEVRVEIPKDCQTAGTVYKVASTTTAVNQQFASFTYVKATEGSGDTTGVQAVEADGEAVYFNLQGQRVANPDRGIFIRVQNGKAAKILK